MLSTWMRVLWFVKIILHVLVLPFSGGNFSVRCQQFGEPQEPPSTSTSTTSTASSTSSRRTHAPKTTSSPESDEESEGQSSLPLIVGATGAVVGVAVAVAIVACCCACSRRRSPHTAAAPQAFWQQQQQQQAYHANMLHLQQQQAFYPNPMMFDAMQQNHMNQLIMQRNLHQASAIHQPNENVYVTSPKKNSKKSAKSSASKSSSASKKAAKAKQTAPDGSPYQIPTISSAPQRDNNYVSLRLNAMETESYLFPTTTHQDSRDDVYQALGSQRSGNYDTIPADALWSASLEAWTVTDDNTLLEPRTSRKLVFYIDLDTLTPKKAFLHVCIFFAITREMSLMMSKLYSDTYLCRYMDNHVDMCCCSHFCCFPSVGPKSQKWQLTRRL